MKEKAKKWLFGLLAAVLLIGFGFFGAFIGSGVFAPENPPYYDSEYSRYIDNP